MPQDAPGLASQRARIAIVPDYRVGDPRIRADAVRWANLLACFNPDK